MITHAHDGGTVIHPSMHVCCEYMGSRSPKYTYTQTKYTSTHKPSMCAQPSIHPSTQPPSLRHSSGTTPMAPWNSEAIAQNAHYSFSSATGDTTTPPSAAPIPHTSSRSMASPLLGKWPLCWSTIPQPTIPQPPIPQPPIPQLTNSLLYTFTARVRQRWSCPDVHLCWTPMAHSSS